jgi:hypothetical protein
MAQAIQYLPSKSKALSSNPSNTNTQKPVMMLINLPVISHLLCIKNCLFKSNTWVGRETQVVEHLPSKYKALSSHPTTCKNKQKRTYQQ